MLTSLTARRVVPGCLLVLLLGVGCGSSGSGCGSFRPLPKDTNGNYSPAPFGLPPDQIVEGGLQARITKPGIDKLLNTIINLVSGSLKSGICIPSSTTKVLLSCYGICQSNGCAGNAPGCAASLQLTSADGKDKITATLSEGDNPVVHIDAKFDVHLPLEVDWGLICGVFGTGSCTLDVATNHYSDTNADPLEITADIQTGIDPATGKLTINLQKVALGNINVHISGCSFVGDVLNGIISLLNNAIGQAITNVIVGLLTPTLNNLVHSLLPDPLGLAGVADTGALLGAEGAPPEAGLELFVVPGGYVKGKAGGITLGVMSGVNSDRDEKTRATGLASEPNLCVPARPTPVLAQAPWNLNFNAGRKTYTLNPAPEFSGTPDPVDAMGNTQDVAIGLSRTFMDLVGFHIYNSGTLCLHIGGGAIAQLNAGTLAVLIQSLNNVIEDKQAPLELVLRPQTPITFTYGVGTMADPLIHVGISDLRIDFYGWIEERFVRILTVGLDLNLGLNLTTTMTPDGKPAIQPTILGLDAKNVTARVSNSDLLHEMPADLAASFPDLLNIAAGAIAGNIGPIALPSVAGFSLDNLSIGRVQTSMDDFVSIYATIKTGVPAPLWDWSDANHPHIVGGVRTLASVERISVPKQPELRALYAPNALVKGARPSVTLSLDAGERAGRPVEWAYRIDHSLWHPWIQDAHPTITDPAFLLQGHHLIEVRSRVVDQWNTEDQTPVALDVLIDSVAPELHPALADNDRNTLNFNGEDVVTPQKQLQYAWRGADNKTTAWSATDSLTLTQVGALTHDGASMLTLYASDEAGNVGSTTVDPGTLGFHGRSTAPSASGCSCDIGGSGDGGSRGGIALALMALVFLWRRKRARALTPLLLIGAVSLFAAGCGCDNGKNQCKVDDDCSKMQCDAKQVPTCQAKMCICTPDLDRGDVGRYSSMQLINGTAYVSAYNQTWGDLMVGSTPPGGIVSNWDFVDGVPAAAPDLANSHVRGGIMDKGDDVGRYSSMGVSATMAPIVAYYDRTHGSLKFAVFGGVTWHSHVVDKGTGAPMSGGDDIGRWTSMTVGPDGKPGIAYSAWVMAGVSGMPESQLRWAQAKTTTPASQADWEVTVLDTRLQSSDGSPPSNDMATGPDMAMATDGGMMATPPHELLPEGIALMSSAARKSDGTPGIAYYDRTRGNLRYIEYDNKMGAWGKPQLLDGEDAKNADLGDVGLYNSLTFDADGVAHISYENATSDAMMYMNLTDKKREIADDGYRTGEEMTGDGLNSPVHHLVGDSSSIQEIKGQIIIAYQDSTNVELRIATRDSNAKWTSVHVAGHETNFMGSFGFYANLRINSDRGGVVSSYAINQSPELPDFFVEVFPVNLGGVE